MKEGTTFWKSGHKPSLFSAFFYFDISFMIWVLLGPLSVIMMEDYPMTASQKANLVALPVLGGSVLRLVLGFLTDYIGPKRTGQLGMLLTMVPLIWGWRFVDSLGELHVIALLLGIAGASSRLRFRSPAAGIRRSIKAWRWASPEPGTAARC